MALTQCPECDREMSDRAAACPGCGAPNAAAPRAVVTIEATGKRWKALQLGGSLVAILSLFACATSIGAEATTGLTKVGAVTFWLGVLAAAAGQAGAWWDNR